MTKARSAIGVVFGFAFALLPAVAVTLGVTGCSSNSTGNAFSFGAHDSGTTTDATRADASPLANHDGGTTVLGDDGGGTPVVTIDGSYPVGAPHGCDPTCVAAGGMCVSKVCVLHENPGLVTMAAQQQLETSGTADPAFKWLYPYDGTVFPRGLQSPSLQWGGSAKPLPGLANVRATDTPPSRSRCTLAPSSRTPSTLPPPAATGVGPLPAVVLTLSVEPSSKVKTSTGSPLLFWPVAACWMV